MEQEEKLELAVKHIARAAEILGWNMSFRADTEDIDYIVIADPRVIDEVTKKLE